jgi:hypothetical protein
MSLFLLNILSVLSSPLTVKSPSSYTVADALTPFYFYSALNLDKSVHYYVDVQFSFTSGSCKVGTLTDINSYCRIQGYSDSDIFLRRLQEIQYLPDSTTAIPNDSFTITISISYTDAKRVNALTTSTSTISITIDDYPASLQHSFIADLDTHSASAIEITSGSISVISMNSKFSSSYLFEAGLITASMNVASVGDIEICSKNGTATLSCYGSMNSLWLMPNDQIQFNFELTDLTYFGIITLTISVSNYAGTVTDTEYRYIKVTKANQSVQITNACTAGLKAFTPYPSKFDGCFEFGTLSSFASFFVVEVIVADSVAVQIFDDTANYSVYRIEDRSNKKLILFGQANGINTALKKLIVYWNSVGGMYASSDVGKSCSLIFKTYFLPEGTSVDWTAYNSYSAQTSASVTFQVAVTRTKLQPSIFTPKFARARMGTNLVLAFNVRDVDAELSGSTVTVTFSSLLGETLSMTTVTDTISNINNSIGSASGLVFTPSELGVTGVKITMTVQPTVSLCNLSSIPGLQNSYAVINSATISNTVETDYGYKTISCGSTAKTASETYAIYVEEAV